jgi:hypothetical protein
MNKEGKQKDVDDAFSNNIEKLEGKTRNLLKTYNIEKPDDELIRSLLSKIYERASRKHLCGNYQDYSAIKLLFLQIQDICAEHARNLIRTARKGKHLSLEGFENLPCMDPSIIEKLEHQEEQQHLQDEIDPLLLILLKLRAIKWTHKKIASYLGLTEASVKMKLKRWRDNWNPKP